MAVYQIVKEGDPVLREKARAVPKITANVLKLLDNMADTMYDAEGIGLAAPQIGISKRVIVVDAGQGLLELINPQVTSALGTEEDIEGCLSIPGVQGNVARATQVIVTALNRDGAAVQIEAEGLLARALQHEIDHLDGILFVDLVETTLE